MKPSREELEAGLHALREAERKRRERNGLLWALFLVCVAAVVIDRLRSCAFGS